MKQLFKERWLTFSPTTLFRFNDWPLATKLVILPLVSAVALAAIGVVSFRSQQAVEQEVTALEKDVVPGAVFMLEMEAGTAELMAELGHYLDTGEESVRTEVEKLIESLPASAREHTEYMTRIGEGEGQAAQEIEDHVVHITDLAEQIIATVEVEESSGSIAVLFNQLRDERHELEPLLHGHLTTHLAKLDAAYAAVNETQAETTQTNTIASVVAVLAVAGLTFVQMRVFTRQVTELERLFSDVRIGEFGSRARVFGRDELGRAADGVNAMLDQILGLLEETDAAAKDRIQTMALLGWAWETDAEGCYTYCSDSVADVLGYSAEEVVGMTPFDFMLPEEAERIGHVFDEMMANKQPLIDLETWNRRKDGKQVCLLTNAVPTLDGEGNLVGYRGAAKDITERKQSEAEIRQILDTAAGGMRLIDLDFNVLRVNETLSRMTGTSPAEMVGRKCHETFHSPLCHSSGCTLTRLISGENIIVREVDKERPDGTHIPCVLTATSLYGPDGKVVGIVEDFRDITEQQRVIADVEHATTEVAGATAAMAEVVQTLIDQASRSTEMAEHAAASAQEGNQVVGETVAAMSRIRDNTQETSQRIKRLGEASQEVSEFVRLIEEIADRTTVLALNASIQAAAAGDAGRGFAVVAEEVQRLAERATGATREIEELVKNIQAETNQAAIGVEEATREVVEGSQLAQQAGERIADLNDQITRLTELVQQATETSAQQTGTSVATLTELSQGLQASVAAFGLPGAADSGNGNGSHGNGDRAEVRVIHGGDGAQQLTE